MSKTKIVEHLHITNVGCKTAIVPIDEDYNVIGHKRAGKPMSKSDYLKLVREPGQKVECKKVVEMDTEEKSIPDISLKTKGKNKND